MNFLTVINNTYEPVLVVFLAQFPCIAQVLKVTSEGK